MVQSKAQQLNRDCLFDNLKGIGIFLVVLGHLIEQLNTTLSITLYKFIYLFHMPLFVFISGFFSRFNLKKIVTKALIPYLILQLFYTIFEILILKPQIDILYIIKPKWVLWYLFALIIWKCSILIISKIKRLLPLAIIISVVISLFFGYLRFDGYFLSISRIIVFYPYFLLGYFFKQKELLKLNLFKNKYTKIITVLIATIGIVLFFILFPHIDKSLLYGALNYHQIENNTLLLRLLIYFLASIIIFSLLCITSKQKSIFTTLGKESFILYIVHAPFATLFSSLLSSFNIPCPILISLTLTILLITVIIFVKRLYLYISNKGRRHKIQSLTHNFSTHQKSQSI